jgi:hypothetical protein
MPITFRPKSAIHSGKCAPHAPICVGFKRRLLGIRSGSSPGSAGLPDMRLVLIFFWLHAAIIIVAAPIESNKARRAPIAGPMRVIPRSILESVLTCVFGFYRTQLEAADDDYSSTVANGHDFVESNTLGSGGVTSVSAADVTLATKSESVY